MSVCAQMNAKGKKLCVEAQLLWKTLLFLCLTKLMWYLNNVKKAYFGIFDVLHVVEESFPK